MDIIIPFHPKDAPSVRKCVISCRVFVQSCRNIYLVSKENPNIKNTIWIDESLFPFTYNDIHVCMTVDGGRADRTGWYLQQLLKIYVDTVIPELSDNYLIVDSDVVFRRPIKMLTDNNIPLLCHGHEYYKPYFTIMNKLIPGLERQIANKSGICHHIIFTRTIMKEIRECIETIAGTGEPAWKIIMNAVDKNELSGFSEYELYFNYCLKYHPNSIIIRGLRWKDAPCEMPDDNTYDYVAYHSWMRR
jgi:hypothetical protein